MQILPTLSEIFTGVKANLDAEYGINISLLKKVALRAIAAMHSGKLWLIYKVIAFLQKNIWPDTADSENKGGTLERFGRIRLGRNPDPAVAGQYSAQVTGSIGAVIPAQQTFKSNDTALSPGLIYVLDSAYVLVATTDTIVLRALTAGLEAKLNIGDTLKPTSPIALVNDAVQITAETVQPLAAESLEEYRAKILSSFRAEAQGGAAADYRLWSLDVQGVAIVYPYPKSGEVNSMNVYVEATVADSTDGKGTPSGAMITDVEAVINFNPDTSLALNERGRKPATVKLYVLPVTIDAVIIEITGFIGITLAQQTLLLNALTAAIAGIRPFVAAADVAENKNDIIDTNKINGVIYSQIPGAVYTSVTLKVNAITVLTHTQIDGNIPWLQAVNFL